MTNDVSLELGPASLTEALYESVRKRIVNGEIPQGTKLTEMRLATEYKVARPTAKAVLERLTALGLLRRTAHKTAVVPTLDQSEIRDLFFSRATIERAAVSSLARTGEVPAQAKRAQTAIEYATRDRLFEDQVEADIAFHSALVAAVGSRRLSRMHELILGEVHLTMGQYKAHRTVNPTSVAKEHAAILRAIEAGDPEKAAKHLDHHLGQAEKRLMKLFESKD
ncbi:GntR family transcriptional regulator [Saccharopolyspora sp. K220]|uniref:GntR family transcriptional regulator n=1 Tax=Saccharopolyspora soli TaxID=2926618 RepID=UPI001F57CDD3|nr:GntR family transcriptional regulator [Saccharopolyspora soli]MCI2419579.1 GntR family transcriptional regulator [Saccharopolyspora soli]